MINIYKNNFERRKIRTRAKIKKIGSDRPRLSVFRSNRYLYAQIIDLKNKGRVLVAASTRELKEKKTKKTEQAKKLGILLAEKAKNKKIKFVVFDKGGYSFKGRIKALAEAAHQEGLNF